MNQPQNQRRSYCPITFTLEIIGDRWAMLIIRDIIFKEKSYFGDFLNSDEGIATNILTNRLKRLVEQNIISKDQDEKNLSKYVYRLTDKGLDLLPMMVEMIAFAGKHDEETLAPKHALNKIKHDRESFINDFRQRYKNGK